MRVITFKIDEDLLHLVDQLALTSKKTRSMIIREALEEYIINNMVKRKQHKVIIINTPREPRQ